MMLAYGHQIAPQGDIYVTIADTALRSLAKAGIYGTYLVDYCSFRGCPDHGTVAPLPLPHTGHV